MVTHNSKSDLPIVAKTNTPHYLDVLCQAPTTTGLKQYADIFEYFQAKKMLHLYGRIFVQMGYKFKTEDISTQLVLHLLNYML